jgi:hypothetical protein
VYGACARDVLSKSPVDNWITLTFHDSGLLETCSYFPKNCADDCAVGVSISTLQFLPARAARP